ncbi:hypothetical protein BVC80_8335g3 [Macleaya cordata]|uniref:Secreted protein n=1 Tax=Macleaya cordata TaxID=56857 RepID=A0A200R8K2_MACCD|nr:hypothetical protein BVC80_8335g3 [Macleaya cordata]
MVMPLIVLAKLPLLHLFKLSPLLWPFNLYLPFARQVTRMCNAITNGSLLFGFRVRQVLAQGPHYRGRRGWERAFLLLSQLLGNNGLAQPRLNDMDRSSLNALLSVAF